jgi:hypothetical protein
VPDCSFPLWMKQKTPDASCHSVKPSGCSATGYRCCRSRAWGNPNGGEGTWALAHCSSGYCTSSPRGGNYTRCSSPQLSPRWLSRSCCCCCACSLTVGNRCYGEVVDHIAVFCNLPCDCCSFRGRLTKNVVVGVEGQSQAGCTFFGTSRRLRRSQSSYSGRCCHCCLSGHGQHLFEGFLGEPKGCLP